MATRRRRGSRSARRSPIGRRSAAKDGSVLALPDYDSALHALLQPERAAEVRFAQLLSQPAAS
jgi:hypothetical protein